MVSIVQVNGKQCPVCNNFMVFVDGKREREKLKELIERWKEKRGRIFKNKRAEEMIAKYTKDLETRNFRDVWYCDECYYSYPPVDPEDKLKSNLAYLENDIKLEKQKMDEALKDIEKQKKAIEKMIEYYKDNPSRRG